MKIHRPMTSTNKKKLRLFMFCGAAIIAACQFLKPSQAQAQTNAAFSAESWGVTSQDLSVSTGGKILEKARVASRINEVKAASNRGDPYASLLLGFGYDTGIGVGRNPEIAYQLFKFACDSRIARGCSSLGRANSMGEGVPKNERLAALFFQQACDAGAAVACSNLAIAFAQGNGVAKDEERSFALFRQACTSGVPSGCNGLAAGYEHGVGVTRNIDLANQFYQRACDSGHSAGCFNLAENFENGDGVSRNVAQAKTLYQKSCDAGYEGGCQNLRKLNLATGEQRQADVRTAGEANRPTTKSFAPAKAEVPVRTANVPQAKQLPAPSFKNAKQPWDVGPDAPVDEWGLTEFDWNTLNTTMLLWKAGFFENKEKVFARAKEGDVKALVMMQEFETPHSHANPRPCILLERPTSRSFTGKNIQYESSRYAYRPTTNCGAYISLYEHELWATAAMDGSPSAALRRFHVLAQSNLPRAWLTASMMRSIRPETPVVQTDVALRGSLARSLAGKITFINDQNTDVQYNYQCALWLEAIEFGVLVAVPKRPERCVPRKFARLGHPVALQLTNDESGLLARAFLGGVCDAGILLARGWPNGGLKRSDIPMIMEITKAASRMGCMQETSLGANVSVHDYPEYYVELSNIRYAAYGLTEAEIAEQWKKNGGPYYTRLEKLRKNGSFREEKSVLPNPTTIQGVLLRELKYVNDQNNPYFQLLSLLGARAVLGETIDPVMGRYSFSGEWGSYQLSLSVDNLRCTRSAASTESIDCKYDQTLGVYASSLGQDFGTGSTTSTRSTNFRWIDGRWISPQVRQEFISSLANAPIAGSAARLGSQSSSSLCRSLNAGLVAAGGRSTSQGLSPQTWGC